MRPRLNDCLNERLHQYAFGSLRSVIMAGLSLATMVSWADNVSASCGDYLFKNGKPVSAHSMANHSPKQPVHGDVDVLSLTDLPRKMPARPCTGPKCSKHRAPFGPAPTSPMAEVRFPDPAALQEPLSPSAEEGHTSRFPDSERGARYLPSPVFRPPAS